ncbi:hypothetical protein MIR68_000195 [Amoeboaphelidium protococcarum]|nr:hypothetical protein MIR68_000195 [Amoeboaphelidium protococcarum]
MTTGRVQTFTSPVQCPFDHDDIERDMILYRQMDTLLDHLQSCHCIRVEKPHELIYVMQQYLEHYAQRLESSSLTSSTIFNLGGGDDRQSDSNLRFDFQNDKLKQMLAIQQQERLDKSKLYHCTFCRTVELPRVQLFEHFHAEHSFSIGLPDNIVNLEEFLRQIRLQLEQLQCIYCEVTFRDSVTLRKHMRKKKHFIINPLNTDYDQFYIINYLDPSRRWYDIKGADDDRDSLCQAVNGESDSEWSDFNEDLENSALQTACLFCNYVAADPQALLSHHLQSEHSFYLSNLSVRFHLSLYDKIKLINYLRRQQLVNGDCSSQTQSNADIERLIMDNQEWRDAQYLLPTYEDDPIFMALEDGEDDARSH